MASKATLYAIEDFSLRLQQGTNNSRLTVITSYKSLISSTSTNCLQGNTAQEINEFLDKKTVPRKLCSLNLSNANDLTHTKPEKKNEEP